MKLTGRPVATRVRLTRLLAPVAATFVAIPLFGLAAMAVLGPLETAFGYRAATGGLPVVEVMIGLATFLTLGGLAILTFAPLALGLAYLAIRSGWHGWLHVVVGAVFIASCVSSAFPMLNTVNASALSSNVINLGPGVLTGLLYGITARVTLQWFNPELYE